MEKRNPELRLFDSTEELTIGLADYVAQISEASVKERGAFSLVLSGGNLIHLLGKLEKPPYLRTLDWSKWHVFWAEENVVAKKHPDSNYKQAKETLLSKVPILPAHIISVSHGVSGESAAEGYEFSIRQLVRNRTVAVSPSSDCPRFDLILLLLGADGHVASLFPNHPVLAEESQWVASVACASAPRESITLTLPVINSAANVAIVAAGGDVAVPFVAALRDRLPHGSHPAQMVSPRDGKLVWLADASAASLLLRGNDDAATSGS